MIDKLKAWWNKTGEDMVSFASTVTVCFTLVGLFGYALVWVVMFAINILHLGWLVRGWIFGSFAYVAVQAFFEWQAYRLDPENYNFWGTPTDLLSEENENETRVE